jgi:carbamoyltransferase
MYILGINAYHADGSAVLLRADDLVAAVEEERLRRIKHWAGFPTEAIAKVLEIGGISGSDIDHVAISRDPKANLLKKAASAVTNRMKGANIVNRTRNLRKVQDVTERLATALGVSQNGRPVKRPDLVDRPR